MPSSIRQIKETVGKGYKKVKDALPVILFFLILFYTILIFFGISHVMLVSIVTVLFQTNYKRQQSLASLLKLIRLQLFLAVLAYVATINFPLCLIFNILVPFWLIFMKSSQFNPMGYFSGLMTFTFLQLMPVDFHGFCMQMMTFGGALLYFFVVVYLYQRKQKPLSEYQLEEKGLRIFAEWMTKELEGEENPSSVRSLYSLQKNLYQKVYHKKMNRGMRQLNERIHYAFALMYQRAAYFMSSGYRTEMLEDEKERAFSRKMAAYFTRAGEQGFRGKEQRKSLKKEGEELLKTAEQKEEELYIFYQNFLRPFLSVLAKMDEPEQEHRKNIRKLPKLLGGQPSMLWFDSFEIKFALRMSIVLALTFSYSTLSHAEHGFWLPLNAFILLRPMYEDSVRRMKTRFLGTAFGCILLAVLLPLFPGMTGHLLFASILVVGLYTATPGTWQQALCSTCFGLSITTLAIAEKTAVELRLLYVFLAILVVLIVNKFIFPTSMQSQFWYNFKFLFHMQHSYLRILESSLKDNIEYDIICDAQIQYHLVHEQMMEYLKKQESKKKQYYLELLTTSWKMVSEMEQLFVLVNAKSQEKEEADLLKDYIKDYILYTDYILNQVQQMLNMKTEKNMPVIKEEKYQRIIENEPQISFLMTRYSKNLSSLYQTVCKNSHREGTLNCENY